MKNNTVKEEGFDAYQSGMCISDNPYKQNTIAHYNWKEAFLTEAIYTWDDLDDPQLSDYIYKAMNEQETSSERELSKMLGKAGNFVNSLLSGRSRPSDEVMVKIAELAKVDSQKALIDLNIWRNVGTPAQSIYLRMAEMLSKTGAIAALVLCLVTFTASPALAEKVSSKEGVSIYYGK